MPLSCYALALDAALSLPVESLVTRFRAVLLSGLTFGLGAVATGGLRIVDSSYALLGAIGSAAVLAVALVLDATRRRDEADLRAEVAELRRSFAAMREQLTELEVLITALKSSADVALRRSSCQLMTSKKKLKGLMWRSMSYIAPEQARISAEHDGASPMRQALHAAEASVYQTSPRRAHQSAPHGPAQLP